MAHSHNGLSPLTLSAHALNRYVRVLEVKATPAFRLKIQDSRFVFAVAWSVGDALMHAQGNVL